MFDLKRFRNDFKLKQSDLEEILGVNQSFISKIENGKESFPDVHYKTLCERFGEDAMKKYKTVDKEIDNSISVIGDGNVSNTGTISGNMDSGNNKRLFNLYIKDSIGREIKDINELSVNEVLDSLVFTIEKQKEEIEQLKKDKAILQEFVTFLQNKK